MSGSDLREGSLFSGYDGLGMAVRAVTGAQLAWVSDIDLGACKILAHHHPDVPNLGDITTVDWAQVEPVDILTGGFPCQDVSSAGRRKGMGPGTRSGLWSAMCHAVDALRPSLMIAENVRGLLSADGHADVEPCPWCLGDTDAEPAMRALGCVLGDLADIGYDAAWYGLTAASVGAPHGRFRVFIVAWPQSGDTDMCDSDGWATAGFPGEAGSATRPTADADSIGHERGRGARGRRDGLANHGHNASDADIAGSQGPQPTPRRDVSDGGAPADTNGWGCEIGAELHSQPEQDPADRNPCGEHAHGHPHSRSPTTWGQFEPAVRRWERTLNRPAPAPTETSSKGGQRLSPRFVEWMMGLPAGHVTNVPTRQRCRSATGGSRAETPVRSSGECRVTDRQPETFRQMTDRLFPEYGEVFADVDALTQECGCAHGEGHSCPVPWLTPEEWARPEEPEST